MKKADGEVRRLLKVISQIQHNIGSARGCYMDDRSPDRATKVLKELDTAFDLCVKTTGDYYPVDYKTHNKTKGGE